MFAYIKAFLEEDTIFYGLLVLVVGIASFGLGRLSLESPQSTQPATVIVSQTEISSVQESTGVRVVASKNGSKYHYEWCPGASQMKESNKIFFNSITDAISAGYSAAANCPGLE